MRRLLLSIAVFMMGALLSVPATDAQNRRGGDRSSTTSTSRPGRSDRNSHGNSRPGAGATPTRPGNNNNNNGNGNHNRPFNNGGNGFRPGNNNGGSSVRPTRPGNNGNNDHNYGKPGNNNGGFGNRPGNNHVAPAPAPAPAPTRPGNIGPRPTRPGVVNRPPVMVRPTRPGLPTFPTWVRPTPPRNWRPAYRYRIVPNILGITFGINISSALDHLFNAGYAVDGYGTKEVYLRNVSELGFTWDDATLYFESGSLSRSQFFESTSGYSLSRFNSLYDTLTMRYGSPVSYNNSGNAQSATWFGYNGDYINIEYTLMSTNQGYRYFTILTYGN